MAKKWNGIMMKIEGVPCPECGTHIVPDKKNYTCKQAFIPKRVTKEKEGVNNNK